jgi:hypothetical protein
MTSAQDPGRPRRTSRDMRDPVSRGLALAALVVAALGFTGVGEAVRNVVLPAGSVGTAQLRANAVTGDKIRSGSVTSSDVKNGSLKAADLASGTIPAGTAFVVRRATKDLTALGEVTLPIPCDAGQVPVGGGGGFLSATTTDYTGNDFYGSLINSAPANGSTAVDDRAQATGWIVTARSSGGKKRLAGYVICAYTPAPASTTKPSTPTPPSQ